MTTYTRQCLVCQKEFVTKYRTVKYCSRPCYYEMKRIRGDRVNWTEEMKEKFSVRQRGANNPSWKGGVAAKGRARELSSLRYKRLKRAVLARDGRACVKCGSNDRLWLDHIIRWADDPTKRWDINNLQTLCYECNLAKTREEGRRYWVNQFGRSPYYEQ